MFEGQLTIHLKAVLGSEGYVQFCQELGGTRQYIAYTMRDENDIVQAVGRELADKLSRALAPATIRVPLARRDRALHFRAAGLSNARIARRLGITESGVAKLFAREDDLPERPRKATSPAQLDLF
ncbi:MAG: hypothetical protein KGL44_03755 [Sphingomonadales bacterium]|nr:hypothetical protein [Sphingomonadales bacterium]